MSDNLSGLHVFSTLDLFYLQRVVETSAGLYASAAAGVWSELFQFGPTGLLRLCQRRAVFRASHQIINKAKTFSFGRGK